MEMCNGRCFFGIMFVTIAIPPAKIDVAPIPATALPIMRIDECGADAPTTEPTGNQCISQVYPGLD